MAIRALSSGANPMSCQGIGESGHNYLPVLTTYRDSVGILLRLSATLCALGLLFVKAAALASLVASLEGFEPTTLCLEVIQRACFLVTLKLNCFFLLSSILASKPSFSTLLYNIISAKLVPSRAPHPFSVAL